MWVWHENNFLLNGVGVEAFGILLQTKFKDLVSKQPQQTNFIPLQPTALSITDQKPFIQELPAPATWVQAISMWTACVAECNPWTARDNIYIPGRNDDVGFRLTIEQCQERCKTEISFKCRSFDYWKQRRQCYLSSSTGDDTGVRYSSDTRMVHYQLNDCPEGKLTNMASNLPRHTVIHTAMRCH